MSEPESGSPGSALSSRDNAIAAGRNLSREVAIITRGLDFDLEPSAFSTALEDLAEDDEVKASEPENAS
ncbi:MAG: hypothetical protein R3C97_17295 [Geminicoccaceae bacterium]